MWFVVGGGSDRFHREMVATMDEWIHMSMEDIRRFEKQLEVETKMKLSVTKDELVRSDPSLWKPSEEAEEGVLAAAASSSSSSTADGTVAEAAQPTGNGVEPVEGRNHVAEEKEEPRTEFEEKQQLQPEPEPEPEPLEVEVERSATL